MDLSRLKWPIIIAIVVGGGWLVSEGGVNYMYNKFKSGTPGADPKQDDLNEAGLSRLGGFLMKTFRYTKADEVLRTAVDLYPEGKNSYYNWYRLVKCAEKLDNYEEAVQIMEDLMADDAHASDDRVPENDVLRLRADKLIELHDLGEVGKGMRP